ncbi:MAG: FAD-dependent thymidylate synthase [Thermoplasmata archaeon]|nr:FAD-dependent thymidylate synthase [Thermoplasmata archaeon]
MEICRGSRCLKVELIAYSLPKEGDVDRLIAESAAISHAPEFRKLDREKVRHLIELLRKLGHESVFEHASFTFRVEGISRVCSHQLVRHRMASYTQQSQRYVKLKNPKFVVPESIFGSEFEGEYLEILEKASHLYRRMVEGGIRKEDARFILPQGIETKIILTMNGRELRHFFSLRCEKDAQWEIRNLAKSMLKLVYEVAPVLFEDLYQKYIENYP